MSQKWSSPHGRELPSLGNYPVVMGILNVSMDSFSDGGKYRSIDAALAHCARMIEEGAQIIDVGAESTRPNARELSVSEEIETLLPRLKLLRSTFPNIPISVDTYKLETAKAAIESGADIINDVVSFCDGEYCPMAVLAAELGCPMVLTLNSRGEKKSGDFFGALKASAALHLECAKNSGIDKSQIILDVGVGFGKTVDENFETVARLSELRDFSVPLLLGVSRKSMFAKIAGDDMRLRDVATAAISASCLASKSADILRVHDVSATLAAMKTFEEILKWTK